MFDREAVEKSVRDFLIAIGENPERPGLCETPRRVAGYWEELLEGQYLSNAEIAARYSKSFQVGYDSVVIKEVKNVYSHCEHHLALMFNGTVYVAYLPKYWNGRDDSQGYRVIGLSKIPRIVEMCTKRLQLQEKLAADISECIQLATGSTAVYVRVIMDHGCVSARGSKSEGTTDVTYITPELLRNTAARNEIESKVTTAFLRR